MRKTFVSYHHKNDQWAREHLTNLNSWYGLFEDYSVEVGDISDDLEPQVIRRIIRDEYLRDSEVTVLLCGSETRFRKHIDWELKSTMIDGVRNKRSGVLVINLPSAGSTSWHAAYEGEKSLVYGDYAGGWRTIETKSEYQQLYPKMPERIIDNLAQPGVRISVVPWERIESHPERLRFLIENTAIAGPSNDYDLSLTMRMRDHNPSAMFDR